MERGTEEQRARGWLGVAGKEEREEGTRGEGRGKDGRKVGSSITLERKAMAVWFTLQVLSVVNIVSDLLECATPSVTLK